MSRFEPVLAPKGVAFNARMFVKEHKGELRLLMKSVFPYLLVLAVSSIYFGYYIRMDTISYLEEVSPPKTMEGILRLMDEAQSRSFSNPMLYFLFIVQVLIGYFFAVVAVSWHRLVLLGTEGYEPMHALRPRRSEIDFVIMWTFLGSIIPYSLSVLYGVNMWSVILLSVITPYIMFKISFYFPAKALDSHLSLGNSFRLTSGFFWKFLFSIIRSLWRVSLVFFVIMVVVGAVCGGLSLVAFEGQMTSSFMKGAYHQILIQPVQILLTVFIFQPLFTVLGVTVLSNYYQHALRHKPV